MGLVGHFHIPLTYSRSESHNLFFSLNFTSGLTAANLTPLPEPLLSDKEYARTFANLVDFARNGARHHHHHVHPNFDFGRRRDQGIGLDWFRGQRGSRYDDDHRRNGLGTYIQNLEALHDSGKVPKEFAVLSHLSEEPDDVDEDEIESKVAPKRKRALISTWKSLRANDFSLRVLTAYGHRCAMCGVQLKLIEGAHILPVSEPTSTDVTANGVALCAMHHKAFDRGLVTFDKTFKTHINEAMVKSLRDADRIAGLPKFRSAIRPIITTPPAKADRPKPIFVEKGNSLRGWKI